MSRFSKWVRKMGHSDRLGMHMDGGRNTMVTGTLPGGSSANDQERQSFMTELFGKLSHWMAPKSRRITRLSGDEVLVETLNGFYVVIPAWNVDVGIGILRDGIIEPWTNQVFLSVLGEGDHVVNVGANFGYYSMLAAQRVGGRGRVYSIEANPVVFCYLLKSMYWAGFPGIVRPYNCAAVAPDMHGKELEFSFDPQFIGGGNMFGAPIDRPKLDECVWSGQNIHLNLDENRMFVPKGLFSKIKTEGRTVDSLVTEPVNAMLIDAEGSESYVIAGAQETIRKSPNLSMIMEWDPHSYHQGDARREYIDRMWNFLLDEQRFQVWRVCPENYPGIGSFPQLQPLDREGLFKIPHSDLLLRRR